VPAALLILGLRLIEPMHRSVGLAIAELVIYALATVAGTAVFERSLMAEVAGYLRRRSRPIPAT
jgi:hypothetical protein